MVGMTGFEPAASCSQSRRSTKLSHIPMHLLKIYEKIFPIISISKYSRVQIIIRYGSENIKCFLKKYCYKIDGYKTIPKTSISSIRSYISSSRRQSSGFLPFPTSMVKPGRWNSSINQSLKPPCDASPMGASSVYPVDAAKTSAIFLPFCGVCSPYLQYISSPWL